jgi:hypothetical protein
MRLALALVLVLVGSAAAPAFAADPVVCPTGRRAWIDGWTEQRARTETVPACFQDRCIPVYETRVEPVKARQCVPKVGHVQVPVYALRTIPIYETRKVTVCGDVTVPVFASRRTPVMGLWFGCGCTEKDVPLFHVNEQVQCGVRKEHRVLGYKTEKVQVGTTTEKCQVGMRLEERVCGTEERDVVVGTREVRVRVRDRTETVMTRPATTRLVFETLEHPGRWVTVSNVPTSPLANTQAVMTEAQYAAEVSAVSARR